MQSIAGGLVPSMLAWTNDDPLMRDVGSTADALHSTARPVIGRV